MDIWIYILFLHYREHRVISLERSVDECCVG